MEKNMTDGENPNSGNAGPYLTQTQASDRLASILTSDPSALETIAKEEDQDTGPEAEAQQAENVETPDKADNETEGSDEEAETQNDDEAPEVVELSDDYEIELEDGERITLAELKNRPKSFSVTTRARRRQLPKTRRLSRNGPTAFWRKCNSSSRSAKAF